MTNIFFSRITGPISTKLGIKYHLVKGIQFYSNEVPIVFQWEIITKLLKYIIEFEKSSFPEPIGQFQHNLAQTLNEGNSSSLNEGSLIFQREIIRNIKDTLMILKNHLLQNHWANFNHTWQKASLVKEDLSLFKWKGHTFLEKYIHEIKKSSLLELLGQFYNIYNHNFSKCTHWF